MRKLFDSLSFFIRIYLFSLVGMSLVLTLAYFLMWVPIAIASKEMISPFNWFLISLAGTTFLAFILFFMYLRQSSSRRDDPNRFRLSQVRHFKIPANKLPDMRAISKRLIDDLAYLEPTEVGINRYQLHRLGFFLDDKALNSYRYPVKLEIKCDQEIQGQNYNLKVIVKPHSWHYLLDFSQSLFLCQEEIVDLFGWDKYMVDEKGNKISRTWKSA